ncbi:MAG: PQQ-binding-like beta-propeller repeat protein [Ferruginibacter sp.]
MKQEGILYILSKGRVAAINKKDGEIIWQVKLKEYVTTGTSNSIGQLMAEHDKLYVGCDGVLICLSAKDGSLIWKNELKGWGYQFVSMANMNSAAAGAIAQQAAASSVAVIAATT